MQISGREMFYFNPDLAAADQCEEGDEAFESYNLEEEDGQNSVEVLNFPCRRIMYSFIRFAGGNGARA